jgi:hypothetical protein
MMTACCPEMEDRLRWRCEQHDRPGSYPDCVVWYYPGRGEFGLPVHDGGSSYIAIRHCPWCGAALPGPAAGDTQTCWPPCEAK